MSAVDGLLVILLVDVSQDVVQDEVARGLGRKNKGLDKLLGFTPFVGSLTNDLDNDIVERRLGVDVGYADFAVLEVELLDSFLDDLKANMSARAAG